MNRLLLFSLLLAGCGTPPAETHSPLSVPTDYRDAYAQYWDPMQAQLASGQCKVDGRCGSLSFVNCRIEVDGPGYYVDDAGGRILEVCGGACMLRRDGYCVACPPPEWTCRP